MNEIEERIVIGEVCEVCRAHFDEAVGYPRTCEPCKKAGKGPR